MLSPCEKNKGHKGRAVSETRLVPYTSICLLGIPAASNAISDHRHGPCYPTSPPRGEVLALRKVAEFCLRNCISCVIPSLASTLCSECPSCLQGPVAGTAPSHTGLEHGGVQRQHHHWFCEEDVTPDGAGGRRGRGEWGRAGHSRPLSQDRDKNEEASSNPFDNSVTSLTIMPT